MPYKVKVMSFLCGSDGKESACHAGDLSSIPRLGRYPGEGSGNPLQYFSLENPMDGRALQATVHTVAKSQTRLSGFTFTLTSLEGLLRGLSEITLLKHIS